MKKIVGAWAVGLMVSGLAMMGAGAGDGGKGAGDVKATLLREGLSGDVVNRVMAIIPAETATSVGGDLEKLTAGQRKEMDAFVKMFSADLAKDDTRDYWFAYCFVTGIQRAAAGEAVDAAAQADQKKFAADVAAEMHDKLLEVLPPGERAAWKGQIDKGMDAVEKQIEARVAELSGETFCPAFKAALTERVKNRVTKMLEESGPYPKYGDSLFGKSVDDSYQARLDAFFRNAPEGVLYWMFENDMWAGFDPNPFWGYMTFSTNSTDGHWPVQVEAKPNTYLNQARGFKGPG